MSKRKLHESGEILKKLEEICAQLNDSRPPRRRRRIRRISSDEESNSVNEESANNVPTEHSTSVTTASEPAAASGTSSETTCIPSIEAVIPSSDQVEQHEIELDAETLQLLGDAPKTDTLLGSNIHKDIASRWQEILTKGLPKEIKENILKEHLIPANCAFLVPPVLNAEVKVAIPDSLIKRDHFLAEKQKQTGIALAALAKATDMLIKKEDYSSILKTISDAGRILCDLHFNETKSRRSFIVSATNVSMKDTLMDTKRDKYLFGENVSEILKSAKNIQKSGADLKRFQRNTNPKFNQKNFYKNKPLNTRGPQRKVSGKPDVGKPRGPAAGPAATTTTTAPPRGSTRPASQWRRSPPHRTTTRRY